MRRKVTTHVAAVLATAALTGFMAATPAGATPAANVAWHIQKSPDATRPGGQIQSVSCSSAVSCTAVGSYVNVSGLTVTLAEAWNGTTWQKQVTPNPAGGRTPSLFGVSCPSANFCEAVGVYYVSASAFMLAEVWNGSSWKEQSIPNPAGSTYAAVGKVSCPSTTFCEAVGEYFDSSGATLTLAETWNGTSWSMQSTPNPADGSLFGFSGVSCVSARFCEAVGYSPDFAEVWNGTSWQLQTMPAGVADVSCASAKFCEAIGGAGSGGGAVWNGTSWTAQTIPSPPGSTSARLSGVSCAAAAFCEAVGSYSSSAGGGSLAEAWNGTSWSVQSAPSPAGISSIVLSAVSCITASACEASGSFRRTAQALTGEPLAEAWNGTAWTIQPAVKPAGAISNSFSAVSCASITFCEAVGSHPDASGNTVSLAETWNGASWKVQVTPNPARASGGVRERLSGVSCVSVHFCEAVGSSGSAAGGAGAEAWNGSSWKVQAVPGTAGLTAVSCTSAKFCMAAGGSGQVNIWDGTSWSAQSSAPHFTSLSSVSCASAQFCEAVGSGPAGKDAEVWRGASWSSQATPTPAAGSSIGLDGVSCATASYCEAVGSYTRASQAVTLAEAWNGTAWVVQHTPDPKISLGSYLYGVSCTSASSCTSAGKYSASSGTRTLAQVWNGTSWSLRSTPNHPATGGDILSGVSCGASGACTAVGTGSDAGQFAATLVEAGD
jgi:hypothetical protein